MDKPQRIQLSRKKGWRMPENSRHVGRPTKFGNPFRVGADHPLTGQPMDAQTCVDLYRAGIVAGIAAWKGGSGSYFHDDQDEVYQAWEAVAPHLSAVEIGMELEELRGKNLACWCPIGSPCHADVLLAMANEGISGNG